MVGKDKRRVSAGNIRSCPYSRGRSFSQEIRAHLSGLNRFLNLLINFKSPVPLPCIARYNARSSPHLTSFGYSYVLRRIKENVQPPSRGGWENVAVSTHTSQSPPRQFSTPPPPLPSKVPWLSLSMFLFCVVVDYGDTVSA